MARHSVHSSWQRLVMFVVSIPRKLSWLLRALMPLHTSLDSWIFTAERGSSSLRRTLFLVMGIYLQNAPADEPIYQFMDKKRSEGKPYKVYMMASANKFLRIYYTTVKAYWGSLEEA